MMGKVVQISNLRVLYYRDSKKMWGLSEKQWKLAHTKTGEPVLDEKELT